MNLIIKTIILSTVIMAVLYISVGVTVAYMGIKQEQKVEERDNVQKVTDNVAKQYRIWLSSPESEEAQLGLKESMKYLEMYVNGL